METHQHYKNKMDKKKEAKQRIKKLVERFDANISQYKKANYDEANTRTDFIDPFFENLGWDVANKQGYAEQYREVVREAKVIIAGKHKAPDYSFRIGGIRKFFVEAKKPSVDIKHQVSPAYQLKRYAYTAKLPLSILTDFEEFSVYDTRIKPTPKDSASCARIFYCEYKDYLKDFDFIYDTFSKDGILKGSFDRYIESSKNKKGTSEVDKEFLKLIDKWREKLAKNIALRNKSLSLYELNFAVQKIIDRIIFLRITEDRQIEDYGKLQNLLNGVNTYKRLMEIFLHSDKKYNSGLFDFNKDKITFELSVDDKIIKEILKSVYYPESPYEFSVLDVEILGNIYEQFLGKTIRLTPAHQVKVEEKPEVKKAGGVYYTPKYIVDYIVKNTVGEIIKGKTPKQIDKIKILDPACGSGSFLLGAYQELLNYHLNWYSKDTSCKRALKKGQIVQIVKGSFQLTIAEKQRILLNNIFGVDIDTQAVEVSKLSILLKLLEGETEESSRQLFRYTQMKLLPDLSNNIKCGNSLIGTDYYKQMSLLNDNEARRINVFDWESAFPDIFENGGFDCVIGNPPYVKYELLSDYYKKYFPDKYQFARGSFDIFQIFLEKAYFLLKEKGLMSFIFPSLFLKGFQYKSQRKFFLESTTIKITCDCGDSVFVNVKMPTAILVIERMKPLKSATINFTKREKYIIKPDISVKQHTLCEDNFAFSKYNLNLEKVGVKLSTLDEISKITRGLEIGKDKKVLCSGDTVPILFGENIDRYFIKKASYISLLTLRKFSKPKNIFSVQKIMIRETGSKLTLVYDDKGLLTNRSLYNIRTNLLNLKYLLGILNSKVMQLYYKNKFKAESNIFPKIRIAQVKQLPIRTIDFTNPSEKAIHNKLVAMVERMLELQKKFHSVRLESDKTMYKTRIDVLDNQIDSLVYELYGLTEKEIRIIER